MAFATVFGPMAQHGLPIAVGVQLGVPAALSSPDHLSTAALSDFQTGLCLAGLRAVRVDHRVLLLPEFYGQARNDIGEDCCVAPVDREAIACNRRWGRFQCLCSDSWVHAAPTGPRFPSTLWAVSLRRVSPMQPVTIDEDSPTQNTPVIDTWPEEGRCEIRLQTPHTRMGQPEKTRHVHRSVLERRNTTDD